MLHLLTSCFLFAEAVGNVEKPLGENSQQHCKRWRDQSSMMLLKETFQTWQLNKGPVEILLSDRSFWRAYLHIYKHIYTQHNI